MNKERDIRLLDLPTLKELVVNEGQPSFRAKQIYEWLWKRSAHSFEEMSNLPKGFRSWLSQNFVLRPIKTDKVQQSEDGTIKSRFALHDGHLIESVLIP